jgi:hypothetical protein
MEAVKNSKSQLASSFSLQFIEPEIYEFVRALSKSQKKYVQDIIDISQKDPGIFIHFTRIVVKHLQDCRDLRKWLDEIPTEAEECFND